MSDLGNWLNLPYQNAGDTNRPLIHQGLRLQLHEALPILKAGRITPERLRQLIPVNRAPVPAAVHGQPAAGRNDAVFKAVLRLKGVGLSEEKLREVAHLINDGATTQMHPNFSSGALSAREVDDIVDSTLKYGVLNKEDDVVLMPDEALNAMNSTYAIVREGGKTLVIGFEEDEILKRRTIVRSSLQDIRNFHPEPVLVGSKGNKPIHKPLGLFWTTHPKARRYKQVVFSPGAPDRHDRLNLWRNFAVEAMQGDCSLFYDHLLNNVCSGNRVHYDYFLSWMARMFQQPGTQGEVIIVMRGGRGTGKGIIAKTLIRLIGQHAIHISNGRHLTGNFNAHLQDVVFVFSDESFWAGDKTGENTLKTLATEPTIMIERKGIDAYTVPNFTHIIMASNSDWVVSAGHDERRYCILDVSDARKQDTRYFGALLEQLENGGYEALLFDMMNRDISEFNVRDVPQTEGLKEQKLLSLDAKDRWFLEILMDGMLPEDHGSWSGKVSKKGLQSHYVQCLKDAGTNYRSMSTELGMYLRKLIPEMENTQIKVAAIDSANQRMGTRWVSAYKFPDLATCRGHFERRVGFKIDWPIDDQPGLPVPRQQEIPL